MKFKHETWRKLYVREEGSFARLPWLARAAAGMLLKICDESGRIEVGDQKLADVVAFRMGATVSDRRMMHKLFPLLEEDRYIVKKGSQYVIRNYHAAQKDWRGDDASSQESVPGESETSDERTINEPSTSDERVMNESLTRNDSSDGKQTTFLVVPSSSDPSRVDIKLPSVGASPPDDSSRQKSKRAKKPPAERKHAFTPAELATAFTAGAEARAALGPIDQSFLHRIYRVIDSVAESKRDLNHIRLAGEFTKAHPFEKPAGIITWKVIAEAGWLMCRIDAALKWAESGKPVPRQASGQPVLFQTPQAPDPRLAAPKITQPKGKPISEMTDAEREAAGLSRRPQVGVA